MAALPARTLCSSRDNLVIAAAFKIAVSPLVVLSITLIAELRRKNLVMHAPVGHPAQHVAAVAAEDAIIPAGLVHGSFIAQCLAHRKRNLLQFP